MIRKPCPDCSGTGRVYNAAQWLDPRTYIPFRWPTQPTTVPCSVCEGTGVQWVKWERKNFKKR